jgi:hypothetical protein
MQMSTNELIEERQTVEAASTVAFQYVRDLGYEKCFLVSYGWKPGTDKKTVRVTIKARRGPRATWKTPEEELHVDVRLTGYSRKMTDYRPSLATN